MPLPRLPAAKSVRLVVFDSLTGLMAGLHADAIAGAIAQLADLARLLHKPLLLTHHLRKRTSRDPGALPTLERLRGASTITQFARLIWTLDVPDPATPGHRRLSVIKNNLGPLPAPLGLTIDDRGLHFGPPPHSPVAITEVQRALHFLRDLLAAGPLPYHQVRLAFQAADLSEPTIRRAKKRLDIRSIKLPGASAWHWTLPSH